jgi:hypothetical protein
VWRSTLGIACVLSIGTSCRGVARDEKPVRSDDGSEVLIQERLRIGEDSSGNGYSFSRAIGIASPDSNTIIVLTSDKEVLVFDGRGGLRSRFGRSGRGPGELGWPRAIAANADTVFIVDDRVQAYSLEGRFLWAGAPERGTPESPVRPIEALVPSTAGLIRVQPLGTRPQRGEGIHHDTLAVGVLAPPSRTFERTAALPSRRWRPAGPDRQSHELFGAHPAVAVSKQGYLLHTPGSAWTVEVLSLRGDLLKRISVDVPRVRVTQEDAKQYVEANSSIEVAEFRPVLGRIVAGDDSTFLVERLDLGPISAPPPWMPALVRQERGADIAPSRWDIVHLDGRILGRATLPPRYLPMIYGLSGIIGFEFDNDGTASIVRFSVRSSPDS